jgi:hypothetical protein
MARTVGDVLVVMLGKCQLELAGMTARAETAEDAMAQLQKRLDALAPKAETPKES